MTGTIDSYDPNDFRTPDAPSPLYAYPFGPKASLRTEERNIPDETVKVRSLPDDIHAANQGILSGTEPAYTRYVAVSLTPEHDLYEKLARAYSRGEGEDIVVDIHHM